MPPPLDSTSNTNPKGDMPATDNLLPSDNPLRANDTAISNSRVTYIAIILSVLAASFYFNMFIMVDVVFEAMFGQDYEKRDIIKMWNGFLIGQLIGQVTFGVVCDILGRKVSLCASLSMALLGATLHTAARGVQGNLSAFFLFISMARGIVGVGIGGIYTTTYTAIVETVRHTSPNRNRVLILLSNGVASIGSLTVTIVFLIIVCAARPQHLGTVWPVCIGVGTVLSVAALSFSSLVTTDVHTRLAPSTTLSVCLNELSRNWITIARTSCIWLIYGFVIFPKIAFSGVIFLDIADGNLWETAGYKALLDVFVLAASFVCAMSYDAFGKRSMILVSFTGLVIFGLIIGCAFERLVFASALFGIFYALMLFMGNFGSGSILALMAVEPYPPIVRGSFCGIISALGTAGAIAGIQEVNAIDHYLPKRWGFIIAAVCGLFGLFAAYFLPAATGVQTVPLEDARTRERLPDHSRIDISHVVVTPTPAYTKPKDVVRYVPKKTQAGTASLGLILETSGALETPLAARLQSTPQSNPRLSEQAPRAPRIDQYDRASGRQEREARDLREKALFGASRVRAHDGVTTSKADFVRSMNSPRAITHDIPGSTGTDSAQTDVSQRTIGKLGRHQDSAVGSGQQPRVPTRHTSVQSASNPHTTASGMADVVSKPEATAPQPMTVDAGTQTSTAQDRAARVQSVIVTPHTLPLGRSSVSASGPEPRKSSASNKPIIEPTVRSPQPLDTLHERGAPVNDNASTMHVKELPDAQESKEVIFNHVSSSGLQKFGQDPAFLVTVAAIAANAAALKDDGESFPLTRENVERLVRVSLYHPVIYCDDSGSMSLDTPTRWSVQSDAVRRIAGITTRALPPAHGVSLRFINSHSADKDDIAALDVPGVVETASPSGMTPLGTVLREHILKPLVYDVVGNNRLLKRPFLVCIITDGCPNGDFSVTFEDVIKECRQRLIEAGYEPAAVRFCVSQIGNDSASTQFLDRLRGNRDIGDVVYCTTERLDEKYKEFNTNHRLLDEWLLRMLSQPIMFHATKP